MAKIIERIKELGYDLPDAPKPVAAYVTALKIDNMVMTSGVLPMRDSKILYTGKIGEAPESIDNGYKAAELCTLNALSIINDLVGLDNIERIIKVTGFINSAAGFTDQPKVMNGASNLLVEIFGEKGKHIRSAVGVYELPLGASVEMELVVQVK